MYIDLADKSDAFVLGAFTTLATGNPAMPITRREQRLAAARRTRSPRWHDTVAGRLALQTEYAVWYEALPHSLRDTATAAALQAVVELDLDELAAIVPPRGYGRD